MSSSAKRIMEALEFASVKHKKQKRKGEDEIPYINHPIKVANVLIQNGEGDETDLIIAAILHDTVEDTDTTPEEIEKRFGKEVRGLVLECTDDKNLPKAARKELQISCAAKASSLAKKLKLADKICNLHDMRKSPPAGWSTQRKVKYINWCEAVFQGLKGVSEKLERLFEEELKQSKAFFKD